jgi:peptide-methionine (S)-S-oxide reductase
VGYAGGTKKDPAYYSLGDHTETIQIDFDPARLSYTQLLDVFWASHEPVARQWSRQYMSMIHYHNDEQQRAARESQAREETRRKARLFTDIVPAGKFYFAEDYHQKYYLRQARELLNEFLAIYPKQADLISSTAAARVNGYTGRYGTLEGLKAEIDTFGLSSAGRERLLQIVSRFTSFLR